MLAAVLELAPTGVEQVDGDGFVEYALYGAPGELPALPVGAAEVGGVTVRVSGEEVPDDWAERWKRFHRPVLVGDRLWVRPPWAPPAPSTGASGPWPTAPSTGASGPWPTAPNTGASGTSPPAPRPAVIDLVIDPGQAFGTGTHPTTRLCLELLLELEPYGSFADVGCGSGVLAIAAARLGFAPVAALDLDRAAIDATRANARANGVALDRVARADLRREPPPAARVVAANLVTPLLVRMAERLERPPAGLIASGLLEGEEAEVVAAFAPLRERRRVRSGGWSAVLLTER